MPTTDLAQCSKCAALLNDTDEDIAKHRRWHAQLADDFENVRRVASGASTDVKRIDATVRDLVRPIAAPAPSAVTIRVTDDDELEPDANDITQRPSFDLDSIDPDDASANDETEAAYMSESYPAIDRDDDLDTRLANATGQVNLT